MGIGAAFRRQMAGLSVIITLLGFAPTVVADSENRTCDYWYGGCWLLPKCGDIFKWRIYLLLACLHA